MQIVYLTTIISRKYGTLAGKVYSSGIPSRELTLVIDSQSHYYIPGKWLEFLFAFTTIRDPA